MTTDVLEGEVSGGAESTALALPSQIITLPPKRLQMSYNKSDVVTKEGKQPGHFMAEGVSTDVFYPNEMEVAVLRLMAPASNRYQASGLGPRTYFPGKFVDGSKPVCKSDDGVHPVAAYAAEPQLQPMATTCQDCAFSKWNNETKTPPACREKVRLQIVHVDSGLRFTFDCNLGTKYAYRVLEMYQTLSSTVTFENAVSKSAKPVFSYSTLMSLSMGSDGWPVLSFSRIRPIKDWQRFIPLYEDLIRPKEQPKVDPVEQAIQEEVLESI